jgi:hypothetical protein
VDNICLAVGGAWPINTFFPVSCWQSTVGYGKGSEHFGGKRGELKSWHILNRAGNTKKREVCFAQAERGGFHLFAQVKLLPNTHGRDMLAGLSS